MWWDAGYPLLIETGRGVKTARVEVDEIRSAECPKSVALRNPQADDLIQILTQAAAVGESPLGSAASWPGALYDSVKIFKEETARDENARERAVNAALRD